MKRLIPAYILENFHNNNNSGNFSATTMFIDISGFTAMTQTLMKNGKEGAEILTLIINNIFTPAIDAIYINHGFISTFAGDAFTAIFPESKTHPFSAVVAANKIQKLFTEIGLQRSKFGDFHLNVKVGLSYGNVQWGLICNDIQNVYYFRGDAINNCAYSEHQCAMGDTVFDDKFLAVLGDDLSKITFTSKIENYYLIQEISGKIEESFVEIKDYPGIDINKFVPQVILDRKLKGEFRDIVSAFLSFEETDEMNEGISDIIKITDKFGGYFNKVDFGDKGAVALILFGAPVGKEKLKERTCDFGIAVRKMAKRRNIPLRIGMTMGKVFAGFVGSDLRSEYTALGTTINLSARFMMKAEWQEIFIDQRIVEGVENMYDIEFQLEQTFKGFSIKIPIYKLLTKKEEYLTKAFAGEMVGRKAELQQLKKLLEPVDACKFGGVVYIDGIAGIGKSRLINEMKDQLELEKYNWYFLPCDEILRKSFNPFTYCLARLFNQSVNNSQTANKENFEIYFASLVDNVTDVSILKELERAKSFLGALLGLYWEDSLYEQLDSKSRYTNTLYAVKNLFKTLSKIKPVIIELDDGHWIDKDSQNLLSVLTHNIAEFPIIIISACRYNDDESQFSFGLDDTIEKRLELNYLDEMNSTNLILNKFEETLDIKKPKLPKELYKFIWEKSSGNPFYIEQLVLYLCHHHVLDENYKLKRKKIEIPSTVNSMIVARIDRLTEDVKEVIKTASVIGKEFVVKILSTMLKSLSLEFKSDKLQNVINTGKTENIWNSIQEIKYIFKHALIRESVYEIQLKQRLRKLHKLAAETIESIYEADLKEYAEELAFHYERAEETEKAIYYLGIAGYRAKYNFQNEKALNLYERKLAQICIQLKTEMKDITKVLITSHNEAFLIDFVKTLFDKKYFLYTEGKIDKAEETISLALKLAEKLQNSELIGKAYLDTNNLLQARGKLNDALSNLQKAESIFLKIDDLEMLGFTYRGLGIVNLLQGNVGPAFDNFKKELTTFDKTGNKIRFADALGNIGVMYRHVGQFDKALDFLDRQLDIAKVEKQKIQTARALGNKGWVYEGKGELVKAIEFYKKSLVMNRELGMKGEIVRILDNTGFAYQLLNEFSKARKLHKNALEIAQEMDDKESIINILANLGHACRSDKKSKSAHQYYNEGILLAKKYGFKFSLAEIKIRKAELLFKENMKAEAKELNDSGLKLAEELNYTKYINLAKDLNKKL
ncbi:tetratricopeptide repeat protein [Candidatus Cloacimonadota bacterium]